MFHFVDWVRHLGHRAKPHRTVLRYEELEKRILFSADPISELADAAMATQTVVVQDVGDDGASAMEAASESLTSVSEEARTELVFVNDDVSDYEALVAGLRTNDENSTIEVIVLDSDRDGIQQISEILSQYQDISALHFITHGSDGQIDIGSTRLDLETLRQNNEMISGWGDSLTETGDILFYGCNVAESADGEQFLGEIAELTGADVSASDDISGNSDSGGDWTLEYGIGARETQNILSQSAIDEWDGVLDSGKTITVTTTADTIDGTDGLISLREAIIEANSASSDVTIVLGSGTYELSLTGASEDSCATGDLDISGGITIEGDGSGSTIISGSSLSDRAFHIQSGGTLTLNNLTVNNFDSGTITYGGIVYNSGTFLATGVSFKNGSVNTLNGVGGAIWNEGMVTLEQVSITAGSAVNGGGVYNSGTFSAVDTVFKDNETEYGYGGALMNEGTMTLEQVSVIDNVALNGGGIEQKDGTLSLLNSTVSGNSTTAAGGGIHITGGAATIEFSTIANNTINNSGSGGGVNLGGGSASITNSIVANNSSTSGGADINGALTSGGHNIVENSNDFTLDSTDSSADPGLAELALDSDTGQYVHVITSSSGAYNAADSSSTTTLDQRGYTRDSSPDIGAYEVGATAVSGPTISDLSNGVEVNADGGNDAYLIADDGGAILGGVSSFTIEVAFSGESNGGENCIFSYAGGASNGNDLYVIISDDGTIDLCIAGNPVQNLSGVDYSSILDGGLHSLGLSWDSSAGDWALYVDGELTDSGTGLSSGSTLNGSAGTGEIVLGQEQDSIGGDYDSDQYFSGTYYDVRIWNDVRSAEEISANYQGKYDSDTLPDGLVADWQMTGFNGSKEIVDIVSANNLSVGHAVGTNFINSTPVDGLNVDENSPDGTSVGYVVPTSSGSSNLVSDGLFTGSDDTTTTYSSGNTFGDWSVTDNSIVVFNSTVSANSPGGGRIIDMQGTDGTDTGGVIEQIFETEIGKEYSITFYMSGYFDATVTSTSLQVSAGDTTQTFSMDKPDDYTVFSNESFIKCTLTFTATDTNTTLTFTQPDTTSLSYGAYLANVSVYRMLDYSYKLTDDAGGRFTIDSDAGEITVADSSLLDYETATSYDITVQVTNSGGTSYSETMTITLNDVDEVAIVTGTTTGSIMEGNVGDVSASVSGSISISDPDADDSPSFNDVAATAGDNGYGSFVLTSGSWTYTLDQSAVQDLDAGDTVTDTITYTATDGTTQQITITISGTDDAAVVSGTTVGSVTEGDVGDASVIASGTIAITDADADDSPSFNDVAATVGDNGYGSFVLTSGSWTYTLDQSAVQDLDAGDTVTDTITYTATDGTTQQITITIAGANDAPVATNDTATVDEDGSVTGNVLDNDIDADGDTLSAVAGDFFMSDQGGTFAIASDGSYTYTPPADFSGTDFVNYTVTDGNLTATGTLTITVNAVNDVPTFNSTAVTSATEDTAYSYSVTTNDVDGDSLTISATTLPSWLTLTDNGDGTATLTGTPTNSEVGDHSVVLTVSDGTTTTTQSFTIAVGNTNDAPTFDSTAVTSATEDTAYSYSITTSDVDGDSLTISATTIPSWLTLTDNGDGTATLTGTPTNSEVGDHSVVLTVSDGTTTTTQSFTIAVGNTNDAPTFDSTAVTSATEDTAYNYTITTSDVDGDGLTIAATTLPSWLTLTDNGDGTAILTGTPTNSEVGDHSVVLTVSDGTTTTTQSFTIAVGNTNDAPTFDSTAVTSATEDSAYSYSITTSDVDGDSLTISATTLPSWLSLTDNGDGTATLTGTPTNSEVGDHSVVLTVSDGTTMTTQSFTIAVGDVNDAPTFDSTAVTSATEDSAYSYSITTSDVDGDSLTISATTLPSWLSLTDNGDGTATLTGTPTNSEVGDHSVVLTVSDGTTTTTQSFTIAVGNVNDAPTFDSTAVTSATEDTAYSYSITTSDVDGDGLTIAATTLPSWLTLIDNGDGTATLTGTPTNSEVGNHSVVLTVSDGTTTTTQSFTIAVGNVNDAPTFDTTAVTSVTEDTAYNYNITASDADGDGLTIAATTLPSWLTLTDNGDGTATLTGTPTNSEVGDHSVVLTVSDGTTTTTQSFTIVVGNVNDAPTFDSTAVTSATEDSAYSYSITTSDVDGDSLTISTTTLPSWLSLTDNGDGTATLTGTPTNSEVGNHSVVLTVSDGTTTTTQSFTITVSNTNDAPTFDSTAVTSATEDTAYNYNITASDADGDGLTIAATTLPSWLTLTDNGDGTATLTGTPTNSEVGNHSVVLTVSDGATTTIQSFTIAVGNVNNAPTFDSTAVTNSTEDTAYSYNITTSDVDGDSLTIAATTLPSWLTLTDNSDGTATLTGTPTNSEVGDHSVVLTVSDGTTTTTQSFTIAVGNVNDAPTFDSTAVTSATEDTAYNYNITTSDVDGDGLTIAATTLPSWLTLTDNGDGTATLTGTPTNSEVGNHNVVLTVSDGTTTTTQCFTIAVGNVNDAPTFDSTAVTSATEDTAYNYNITTSDVDGDGLTIAATTLPSWLTLTDNGGGTATLTGTPTNYEVGNHSVVLTVSDGTTTTTQSFTIAVGNVNDAPTFDTTAVTSAAEDTAYSYNITTSDVDGDGLTIAATTLPSWLSLTDNGDGTATLTGTPINSEVGDHSVVLTVSDGTTTTTQSFTIAVGNVNDAPTFDTTAVTSATEDTAYSYNITTSDVDGDGLTIAATTLPSWLTLTDNGDGTATLTGAPTNSEVGDHSVVLTVSDGTTTTTQSFTIAVGNTNDAPTFDSTAVTSATEDTAYNYNITTSDVDGDGLTIAATTLPSWLTLTDNGDGTATLTGTPTNSEVGNHNVVLTVSDGTTTTTQSFTIAVGNTNDAPTFDSTAITSATEDTAYSYAITTSDVDGDTLAITATTLPSWLTLTDNGDGTATLSGTPTNSEVGDHSVVLTVSDGTTTTTQCFTIAVGNVNDAPVATNDTTEVDEDGVVTGTVVTNDGDEDGDSLTASLVNDVSHGSLTFNADGSFTYTPDGDYNGGDSFSYTIDDGNGGSASATVSITVNAVNDATTIESTAITTATEEVAYSYTGATNDVDGDSVTITATTLPSWLTLTDGGDGTATLIGTPTNSEVGDHNVVLMVSDGSSTVTQTFTVSVNAEHSNDDTTMPDDENSPTQNDDDLPQEGEASDDNSGPDPVDQEDDNSDDSIDETLIDQIETGQEEKSAEIPTAANQNDSDIIFLNNSSKRTIEHKHSREYRFYSIDPEEMIIDSEFVSNFYNISATQSSSHENIQQIDGTNGSVNHLKDQADQREYDRLRSEIDSAYKSEYRLATIKSAIGTVLMESFTVGIVSYLLRPGALIADWLATLPLWREYDPIAVLSGKEKEDSPDAGDEAQSETLFDNAKK